MRDERAARVAANEARFRDINERLESDLVGLVDEPGERLRFVCECGLADCADPLHLTVVEYEHVREDARHFAVVPGHEIPEVEDVIERHEGYSIIRKHPETWPIVAGDDSA